MKTTAVFQLNRKAFILALISAAFPTVAMAEIAAKVEFASGNVQAVGLDGQTRSLNKGAEINSGDTIDTANGRTQLRFGDGGYISLQPNTKFRVDDYNFEGKTDGQEKSFFTLIQGGLRAITGAVGHVNKNAYRINTPVATIGIRGTEFLAFYDTRLLVRVGNGAVYVSNDGGDLTLFQGQTGEVKGKDTKPTYTNDQPVVGAAGPTGGKPQEKPQDDGNVFNVAEQYNDDGSSCTLTGNCPITPTASVVSTPTPVLGTTTIATIGYVQDSPLVGDSLELTNFGTIVNDGAGNVVSINDGTNTYTNFTGVVNDQQTDGDLSWVRLTGGTFTKNLTEIVLNTNRHIISGTATTAADLNGLTAAFSGCGSYGFYALSGGTKPTDGLGIEGSNLNGYLYAYFIANPFVSVNINFTLAGASYNAGGSGNFVGGSAFALTSGFVNASGGSGCAQSCTFSALGFFAGPQAAQAGLSYLIQGNGVNGDITGVAAFRLTSGGFQKFNGL